MKIRKIVSLSLAAAIVFSTFGCSKNNGGSAVINDVSGDDLSFTTAEPTAINGSEETRELTAKAKALLALNPDTVGWITIPETNIDYPVLQRRDEAIGNSIYLDTDFYGNYDVYGSIFMDWHNSFDVTGERQSDNVILYGHNTVYYDMFSQLHKYMKSIDFYKTSPVITFSSNYETYNYVIFGCILANVYEEDGPLFRYHVYYNFNTQELFDGYIAEVRKRSLFIPDFDVEYGDQLLTLSTCNTQVEDVRLVIFARKLRDGETVESVKAEAQSAIVNPDPLRPDTWYAMFGGSYHGGLGLPATTD